MSAIRITLRPEPPPVDGAAQERSAGKDAPSASKRPAPKRPDSGPQIPDAGLHVKALAARIDSLAGLLKSYPGPVPVWFLLELGAAAEGAESVLVRGGAQFKVRPSPELFASLHQMLPPGAVQVAGEGTQMKKAPERRWQQRAGAGSSAKADEEGR